MVARSLAGRIAVVLRTFGLAATMICVLSGPLAWADDADSVATAATSSGAARRIINSPGGRTSSAPHEENLWQKLRND